MGAHEVAVMSAVIAVALIVFGLIDMVSIVRDIFAWGAADSKDPKELRLMRRRRIVLHLGIYVLIIGGFWAIIHFGPLRPVHEWLR
jgi:predicted MFS family arabinose efflux permease